MSVLHCVSVFYFFLLLNNFPLCVCATFVYSFISLGHYMLYLTWVVCQNGAEGHALGLSLALASLQTLHGSRSIFLFYKHCVKLERIVVLTLCSLSWLHRRQVGYCWPFHLHLRTLMMSHKLTSDFSCAVCYFFVYFGEMAINILPHFHLVLCLLLSFRNH